MTESSEGTEGRECREGREGREGRECTGATAWDVHVHTQGHKQRMHSDTVIRRKAGEKQATVGSCDTFGGRWGLDVGVGWGFSMREGEKEAWTRQPRVCKRGTGRKDEGDGERRRQRKQQEEEQHMSAARSRRREKNLKEKE